MRFALALLASAIALSATTGQAQLLPAGKFTARDGRPGPGKQWEVTDAQGVALAAAMNAIAAKTPIVIDYDHQTIRAEKNGQLAPAAGWILSAEWRKGEGLFAQVEWTPEAKARIDKREYRFISPVITHDEDTGAVTGVHLAALVNHPALLGMESAVAQLSAQLYPTQQENSVDLLTALLASLGLAATTTETEALAAVSALKATVDASKNKPTVPTALSSALGLQADATEQAALDAVTALRKPASGDAAAAALQGLQQQVVQLTGQLQGLQGDKVTQTVDQAIKDHKLVPAQRDWALSYGKSDFTALQAFIAAAPVLPLGGQSQGDPTGGGKTTALSTAQSAIATQLGLDPAKYAEHLKTTAAA